MQTNPTTTNNLQLPLIYPLSNKTLQNAMVQTINPKRNNPRKRKLKSIDSIYNTLHLNSINTNMKRIHLSSVFNTYKRNYGTLSQRNPNETYSKTIPTTNEGIVYVKGPFGKEKKICRITKMHFLKPTSIHFQSQISPLDTFNEKFNSLNTEYKRVSLNTIRNININDTSNIKETQRFKRITIHNTTTNNNIIHTYTHKHKHKHKPTKHTYKYNITSITNRIHSFTKT